MTVSLKHAFAVPGPDDGDPNTVSPSDWNAEHALTVAAASLLVGRGSAAGAGAAEEITIGANLTMTGTVLAASGGASGALALNQHVLAANFTITAGWAAYITRYLEIGVGVTLEIGLVGDLEIG